MKRRGKKQGRSGQTQDEVLAQCMEKGYTEIEVLAAAASLEDKGIELPYTVLQLLKEVFDCRQRMQTYKVHESELGEVLRELSEFGPQEGEEESDLEDHLVYLLGSDLELAIVLKEISVSERKKSEKGEGAD